MQQQMAASITMTDQQIDVKVQVMSICVQYKKDPLEVAFRYPTPQPPREVNARPIYPNYLTVHLLFQDKEKREWPKITNK